MKNVTVHYFALLREERGLSTETVETDAATLAGLYQALASKHKLSVAIESLKVALNDEFSDWESPIQEGDQIVFIPPVAGG